MDINDELALKGLSGPVLGGEPALRSFSLPNGARVAVSVQLAFEAWSPNVVAGNNIQGTGLSAEAISKGVLDYASLSWQDYGGRTGMWRILRVLDKCGVKASCSVSGLAAERWPKLVAAIAQEGHEIVGHGYAQDRKMSDMDEVEDLDVVTRSTEILESVSGQRPVGWSSHGSRRGNYTVLNLLKNGYIYTNDFRDADVPYVVAEMNGSKMVALPRSDEINDSFLVRSHGATPSAFVDFFKRCIDQLHEEGADEPKAMTCVAHGVIFGRPWGGTALAECLDYAKQLEGVWLCTRRELAEYSLGVLGKEG